jgi:hypothetical protein
MAARRSPRRRPVASARYAVPARPARPRRRWLEAAILAAWSIIVLALAAGGFQPR